MPRWNALVLDVVKQPGEPSRSALDEYLTTRHQPLVLIATRTPSGEPTIQARSWSGEKGFAAYGDERALHRAARELGMEAETYGIAAMPVSTLFAWAASLKIAVMLCAFEAHPDGTSQAWHVALTVDDLRRLSAQR